MRSEEFKEDLKKDKRLKADTITSYLSIASDIEKAYELDLDDVVSDDRLMEIVICDHISGMTDQFAVREYEEIFIPKGWGE